jgi:hypothetical protein
MTTIRRRGRGASRIGSGTRARAAGAALVALTVLAAGCGGAEEPAATTPPPGSLPQGAQPVRLDPANFTTKIDNPYWPMTPGSRWVYTDTEGGGPPERVEITVTNRTKVVAGVRARVIHDVARRGSEVIEDTFDWFAQDRAGNIWYLGEATRAYHDGRPGSTRGSWEAGVNGAQAGIAVPASPTPGLEYRQEYRKGRAEDAARVLSIDEQVQSPFGHFSQALLTKDFTPIEPRSVEYKLYAKGVGLVLALGVSGGASREELVSYRKGGG